MTMGSQKAMRKEWQLVMPKILPTEMHLDYHLEMTMGSQLNVKKDKLMDSTMV